MAEKRTFLNWVDTASALETIRQSQSGRQYPAYIGLDVHKETIAVAVARAGRSNPESRVEIANRPRAVAKLIERLNREFDGEVLLFCYEAGPCGYGLYRQLLGLGHDCQVVAPSLIPKKPGDRTKTDRRDVGKLARSLRSGDLTAVWSLPGPVASRQEHQTDDRGRCPGTGGLYLGHRLPRDAEGTPDITMTRDSTETRDQQDR